MSLFIKFGTFHTKIKWIKTYITRVHV